MFIMLTNQVDKKVRINIKNISYYEKNERDGTYISCNHDECCDVKETPEEIDKMISDISYINYKLW